MTNNANHVLGKENKLNKFAMLLSSRLDPSVNMEIEKNKK